MITISNDLQAALASDSVNKDVVISFPYESRADITNTHIVSESLVFQESICSEEKIKFGLAEASYLEFQCFDELDMTGSTIDVSIGVDNDDLTEYVPLGRFIVDQCSKDHVGARLMKVTAYTNQGEDIQLSPVERMKRGLTLYAQAEYRLFPEKFIYANVPNMDASGFTMTQVTSFEQGWSRDLMTMQGSDGGQTVYIYFRIKYKIYRLDANTARYLYWINGPMELPQGEAATIVDTLIEDSGCDQYYPFGPTLRNQLATLIDANIFKAGLVLRKYTNSTTTYAQFDEAYNPPTLRFIDPYSYYASADRTQIYNAGAFILVPVTASVYLNGGGHTGSYDYTDYNFTLYHTGTDYSTGYITLPRVKTKNISNKASYICKEDTDVTQLLTDYAEANGQFAKFGRTGAASLISLDNTSLHTYTKADIVQNTLLTNAVSGKIGKAVLSWNDGAEDNFTEVTVNADGVYTYDLSGNSLLSGLTTEAAVTTALNAFAAAVQDVEYVPLKVQLRGLPQVEAGDRVTIDGNETYVLSRRISGINSLRDEVTAQ